MFERSEFGLRARSPEKRRGPPRLYRGGSRPGMAVLLTFDKTKVSRANSAEALFFANYWNRAPAGERSKAKQMHGFRPLPRASSFLKDQKGTKKSLRRARADAAAPRRFPPLLA